MAYMPEDEKERIKREVSIQRLAEARGIKLRRSGKELIGLCPFHDDRNPSLNIDPAKNVWSCKGACGEGGDVFLWVMRAEGVSFNHAKELLRKNYSPSSGPVMAYQAGGRFLQKTAGDAKAAAGGKCTKCNVETTPGVKSQKGVKRLPTRALQITVWLRQTAELMNHPTRITCV